MNTICDTVRIYFNNRNGSSGRTRWLIWTGVFVDRPTLRASMAQGLFLGGTGRRAVAHTHPEFPKMPTAPSAFPLLGAPQVLCYKPNLPEGSKSLGGRPPEAVGKSPGTEAHSARTASWQLGRPKCYPAPGDVQSEINLLPKWSWLEPLGIRTTAIYGRWPSSLSWKERWYPTNTHLSSWVSTIDSVLLNRPFSNIQVLTLASLQESWSIWRKCSWTERN